MDAPLGSVAGAAADGFFGSVASAAEKGVASLFEDVLPNWVAREISDQQNDQLRNPTFDPSVFGLETFANPGVASTGLWQARNVGQAQPASISGILDSAGNTVLIIGAVVLVGFIILKAA